MKPFAIVSACLLLATGAQATPLVYIWDVQCGITEPVCILVVPDGTGMTFLEARTFDGQTVDASIDVLLWVVDEFGPIGPAVGFFAEWLTIQTPDGLTIGCAQPYVAIADYDSAEDGWTRFSLAPRAGGWSQGLLEFYVVDEPASELGIDIPPLPIYFNSPDINGDLAIDLTDITFFAQDLGSGAAQFRSDLVWDGAINLSDITVFTHHLGASCP